MWFDVLWCLSNIEFIWCINGLVSIDDVKCIVFDVCYLVMGFGDVYFGVFVVMLIDLWYWLVMMKYNFVCIWMLENVVGIGGVYLCVYGMEGLGGY